MIEAFSIHQALKTGNQISPSIYLENRLSSGTQLINGILYAIQHHWEISFTHTKFWEMEITQRRVKPIGIKESQNRWYLIAADNKDGRVKNFGFDRISDLKISDIKFKPISYNVNKAYQDAFGIETYEQAQKVVLEFTWQQGNYIKSFPLHTSQKIISDTEDALIIELYLHPTYDFIMEILKYGTHVEVLEPTELRNTVKERINEMTNIYN
jgi:proteasome accessory factor B